MEPEVINKIKELHNLCTDLSHCLLGLLFISTVVLVWMMQFSGVLSAWTQLIAAQMYMSDGVRKSSFKESNNMDSSLELYLQDLTLGNLIESRD